VSGACSCSSITCRKHRRIRAWHWKRDKSGKASAICWSDPPRSGGFFDYDGKRERLEEVSGELELPDVWKQPERAQELGRERSRLKTELEQLDAAQSGVVSATELLEMAEAEDDSAAVADIERDLQKIEAQVRGLEFKRMFRGEMDSHSAYLDIQAGAGGTEAQDWAQMLLRMYLRWAERHNYKTAIMDITEGEEAGIKSVTVEVDGANAYGLLKAERGTHRLVRLSPFDANSRRHTSFAKLEVMPVLDEDIEVEIPPNDIQIEVYLSSGAGGQNVQKNQTAVRIRHLPTGLIVTSQNERSQTQNREMAMKVLRGRLYELQQEKLAAEKAKIKGQNVEANFGSQIRSYVLHPYQMVKDLRTDVETGNTGAVLDGEIDMFIEAWLKAQPIDE
jgi:peptide chain release factor 2